VGGLKVETLTPETRGARQKSRVHCGPVRDMAARQSRGEKLKTELLVAQQKKDDIGARFRVSRAENYSSAYCNTHKGTGHGCRALTIDVGRYTHRR